ncbi:MAG TPA: hypothetical protein VGR62_20505 [Candidatus Binatia bacterium]|jgi:hypothetical protein|nr:hypothetical protein [Candidatus Binatia bacterium]
MTAHERALEALYRAPLADFVAERTRLAKELRDGGDKAAATDLAKRRRPTISAWTVNQLYWHARDAFDHLLAAATRLRSGDLSATTEHRDTLATLRKRAAGILAEAGHGSVDTTLRRVSTTLAAIAAGGGFDPDPPGALVTDRDPPGFEALGASWEPVARKGSAPPAPRKREDLATARAEAERHAAQQRQEAEQARRDAERDRLRTKLRTARTSLEKHERALSALQREVRAAEDAIGRARDEMHDLERLLAEISS